MASIENNDGDGSPKLIDCDETIQQKQHSVPMTPDEDDVLCKEYKLRSAIFLQTSKTADANKKKNNAWKEIAQCVAAVNPMGKKSIEQLKYRHKYLTGKAKAKSVTSKREKHVTGGGCKAPELTTAEQEILSVHKDSPSWVGLPNSRESIIGGPSAFSPFRSLDEEESQSSVDNLLLSIPPIDRQLPSKKFRPTPTVGETSFQRQSTMGKMASIGEASLQRPSLISQPKAPPSTIDLRQVQIEALQAQIRASNAQTEMTNKLMGTLDELKEAAKAMKEAMISLKNYTQGHSGAGLNFLDYNDS